MGDEGKAHVGRQAIYDRDGAVVGYELLFRAATGASTAARADGHATARVLVAAVTEFGLEAITDSRVCFLNVTREFVTGQLPLPFDCSQAVLEVLESTGVDDEVIAGITVLVERGFTIAVDDYVHGTGREALLPLATYAKIDMLNADEEMVRAAVEECRRHPQLQLVAVRLETHVALRLALELGFELFQGHILGHPQVTTRVGPAPSRIARLRVLAALSNDDIDVDEVITQVSQDAGLSMRLLRATNAASFGLTRTVSSVREAVVALGLNRLRQWVTLMLVSDLSSADPDQLSRMLVQARLCQALAEAAGESGEIAYFGGLLCAVAEHFDEPLERLVEGLPLDVALTEALVQGTGAYGLVFVTARAYLQSASGGEVPGGQLVGAYLDALRWANGVMHELSTELPRRPNPVLAAAGS